MTTTTDTARTASPDYPVLLAPLPLIDLDAVRNHLRQLNLAVTSGGLYRCACDALALLGEVERLTDENTALKHRLADEPGTGNTTMKESESR
jgi:hypothetical protein